MAGPIGLQQLLRMQGIEWGDAANGDKYLWFDGGSLNTNATWNTSSYGLQTAPSPWTNGGNGNPWGWAGTSSVIKAAETQSTAAVFNLLTFSGLTQAYGGSTGALENRTYTDTSAQNYTGKIRAEFNQVMIQTATGSTLTRVEPGSNICNILAGADGTMTSGYGVAGELFHGSDTYLVTAFWSVFGTTQLKANGNCTTGYGALVGCTTDADLTGATGTFTNAIGVQGEVQHQNLSTITSAMGGRLQITNASTGTIATARGGYAPILNTSSGTITLAHGFNANVSNTGTGTIVTWQGFTVDAPTVSATHPITTARGMRVSNQGATGVTSAVGLMVDVQSGASSQNINLVLGAQPGSGDWNIYSTSANPSAFNGAIIQGHATAAINSTATATATQTATGYITSTSAAPTTITLPTGTLLGTALKATQGTIHYLTIDNTAGANTVTVAVAVNGILSADAVANAGSAGLLTIPSGVTGQGTFMLMFSSATAYTFTRIA